jgi:hypothetical protein
MQDFYRCEAGYEDRANQVANKACYKLVKDMHYEARIQAVIQFCADHEKRKVKKEDARNIFLTLYSFLVNLIFQYIIHLITCRCLLTGAPARARAGL